MLRALMFLVLAPVCSVVSGDAAGICEEANDDNDKDAMKGATDGKTPKGARHKSPMKGAYNSQHVDGDACFMPASGGVLIHMRAFILEATPYAACGKRCLLLAMLALPHAGTRLAHITSSSSLIGAQCSPPGRAIRI